MRISGLLREVFHGSWMRKFILRLLVMVVRGIRVLSNYLCEKLKKRKRTMSGLKERNKSSPTEQEILDHDGKTLADSPSHPNETDQTKPKRKRRKKKNNSSNCATGPDGSNKVRDPTTVEGADAPIDSSEGQEITYNSNPKYASTSTREGDLQNDELLEIRSTAVHHERNITQAPKNILKIVPGKKSFMDNIPLPGFDTSNLTSQGTSLMREFATTDQNTERWLENSHQYCKQLKIVIQVGVGKTKRLRSQLPISQSYFEMEPNNPNTRVQIPSFLVDAELALFEGAITSGPQSSEVPDPSIPELVKSRAKKMSSSSKQTDNFVEQASSGKTSSETLSEKQTVLKGANQQKKTIPFASVFPDDFFLLDRMSRNISRKMISNKSWTPNLATLSDTRYLWTQLNTNRVNEWLRTDAGQCAVVSPNTKKGPQTKKSPSTDNKEGTLSFVTLQQPVGETLVKEALYDVHELENFNEKPPQTLSIFMKNVDSGSSPSSSQSKFFLNVSESSLKERNEEPFPQQKQVDLMPGTLSSTDSSTDEKLMSASSSKDPSIEEETSPQKALKRGDEIRSLKKTDATQGLFNSKSSTRSPNEKSSTNDEKVPTSVVQTPASKKIVAEEANQNGLKSTSILKLNKEPLVEPSGAGDDVKAAASSPLKSTSTHDKSSRSSVESSSRIENSQTVPAPLQSETTEKPSTTSSLEETTSTSTSAISCTALSKNSQRENNIQERDGACQEEPNNLCEPHHETRLEGRGNSKTNDEPASYRAKSSIILNTGNLATESSQKNEKSNGKPSKSDDLNISPPITASTASETKPSAMPAEDLILMTRKPCGYHVMKFENIDRGKFLSGYIVRLMKRRLHSLAEVSTVSETDVCNVCQKPLMIENEDLGEPVFCIACNVKIHPNCNLLLFDLCAPAPALSPEDRKRNRFALHEYVNGDFKPRIPALVVQIILLLTFGERRPVKGMYRNPETDTKFDNFKKLVEQQGWRVNLTIIEPLLLGELLKYFFDSLKPRLISRNLFKMLKKFVAGAEGTTTELVKEFRNTLVKCSDAATRETLIFLIIHLQDINSEQALQMSANDLARAFAPVLIDDFKREKNSEYYDVIKKMIQFPRSRWLYLFSDFVIGALDSA